MIADAARMPPESAVAMQQLSLQALHFAGMEFHDNHLPAKLMVRSPQDGQAYMRANVGVHLRAEAAEGGCSTSGATMG
jgi:hypothetical protein